MIRIIIAGSRTFQDFSLLETKLKEYMEQKQLSLAEIEIISGTANGADRLGEQFADKYRIPCSRFPANWDKYGKSAGYIRNSEMAKYAAKETGVLFAFWDGASRGTKHMIDLAKKQGLDVHVVQF